MSKITKQEALDYHSSGKPGKIEVVPTKPYASQRDLSLAYSPGVAEPCIKIAENKDDAYKYTSKANLVAVITNGGVFGSMLSTPIINPPQSAILGMHNIVERPVAINSKVEIRPIMYLALSYDHRIIDGKESVGFLVKVKEILEKPEIMMVEGIDSFEKLFDL